MSTPQYTREDRRAIVDLLSQLEAEEIRLTELSTVTSQQSVKIVIGHENGKDVALVYDVSIEELRILFRRRMDYLAADLKLRNIHLVDGLPTPTIVKPDLGPDNHAFRAQPDAIHGDVGPH